MWKNIVERGQARRQYNTAHALYMLDNRLQTHIQIMQYLLFSHGINSYAPQLRCTYIGSLVTTETECVYCAVLTQ